MSSQSSAPSSTLSPRSVACRKIARACAVCAAVVAGIGALIAIGIAPLVIPLALWSHKIISGDIAITIPCVIYGAALIAFIVTSISCWYNEEVEKATVRAATAAKADVKSATNDITPTDDTLVELDE